ncbi:MAG: DUF3306 domain-containing protein [Polaromonas sp.]|nr:DUF3306 domain-containing protein [Polaromonas sp.]
MADGADGFLGRWARRKNDALQGKLLDEAPPAAAVSPAGAPLPAAVKPAGADAARPAEPKAKLAPEAKPAEPAEPIKQLSLDDVKDLTKESDFKPFMGRGVEPGVRNAAMKKLFADPHFNVMDGLDIYIDDYSKPDPLPLSMLRQMTSAKFLKLFDDDEEEAKKAKDAAAKNAAANAVINADTNTEAVRETAHTPPEDSVAQSAPAPEALAALPNPDKDPQPEALVPSGIRQEDHAHIDLRLQPDHAPESPDTGRGAA